MSTQPLNSWVKGTQMLDKLPQQTELARVGQRQSTLTNCKELLNQQVMCSHSQLEQNLAVPEEE